MSIEGYSSGLEGTQIAYYCQSWPAPGKRMAANCTSDGIWIPNPDEFACEGKHYCSYREEPISSNFLT